jgi:hypothetical protein
MGDGRAENSAFYVNTNLDSVFDFYVTKIKTKRNAIVIFAVK